MRSSTRTIFGVYCSLHGPHGWIPTRTCFHGLCVLLSLTFLSSKELSPDADYIFIYLIVFVLIYSPVHWKPSQASASQKLPEHHHGLPQHPWEKVSLAAFEKVISDSDCPLFIGSPKSLPTLFPCLLQSSSTLRSRMNLLTRSRSFKPLPRPSRPLPPTFPPPRTPRRPVPNLSPSTVFLPSPRSSPSSSSR